MTSEAQQVSSKAKSLQPEQRSPFLATLSSAPANCQLQPCSVIINAQPWRPTYLVSSPCTPNTLRLHQSGPTLWLATPHTVHGSRTLQLIADRAHTTLVNIQNGQQYVDPIQGPCTTAILTTSVGPLLAMISLIFTAGALLLMFLILLAGVVDHNPTSQFYFLQVATANIPGAHPISRWTYWNICSVTAKNRNDCGNVHPAFPFDPPAKSNFGTHTNIPKAFIGTSKFYYLTRFMFAFMLITLFFGVCALFTGILAMCSRIGSYLSGLLGMIALFFQSLNASLMT